AARSADVHMEHAVFVRAEVPDASHVERRRRAANNILHVNTGIGCHAHSVEIPALGGTRGSCVRQNAINQTGISLNRTAGRTYRARTTRAKRTQGSRVAHSRITH